MSDSRTNVAIIGSGMLGTDLMCKVLASESLSLAFLAGRDQKSRGLAVAKERGVETSADGINFLKAHRNAYDIVFDATSAYAHVDHNAVFSACGKFAVDLTPAGIGMVCVPSVNLADVAAQQNISLVTCGGQASLPLAHAFRQATQQIDYLEVVSTIAAASAGMATRENINNYLTTTERALSLFSGANKVKAILNINPAEPGVMMQTTIYAYAKCGDFSEIEGAISSAVASVQEYVPGFQIVLAPILDEGRITVSVKVQGSGHHLPSYAGNLDIINCAAVAVAGHKGRVTRSMQS